MRSTTKAVLTAILFTGSAAHALTCSPPETQDLVGLWESRETSKGGIGHTVEFRPDGTYVEATTVIVDFTYRVSGDRLTVEEVKEDQGARIEIQGDTLIQTQRDGSTLKKKRLGKVEEGSPAIVGAWRYRHPTGVTAYERYTPDGRLLFRLPMTSSTGCYKAAGDRLSFHKHDGKETALSLEMKTGELVLKSPGKSATVYGRAADGPWYDRELGLPLAKAFAELMGWEIAAAMEAGGRLVVRVAVARTLTPPGALSRPLPPALTGREEWFVILSFRTGSQGNCRIGCRCCNTGGSCSCSRQHRSSRRMRSRRRSLDRSGIYHCRRCCCRR